MTNDTILCRLPVKHSPDLNIRFEKPQNPDAMITEHEKHGDKDLPQNDRKENDDNLDSKVNTDFTREEGESQTIQEDPNKEPAEKAPFKRSNV